MEKYMKHFSKIMLDLRNQSGLSQKDIHRLTGISIGGIRSIESGKVVPKIETLKILSPIYKRNLIDYFSSSFTADYFQFLKTDRQLEAKLAREDYKDLIEEKEIYQDLLLQVSSEWHLLYINQKILFIEAILTNEMVSNRRESLDILLKALKLGTPQFHFDHFKEHFYSSVEKRILMNYALFSCSIENEYTQLQDMLELLLETTTSSTLLHIKVCHHYALSQMKFGHFPTAESALEKAIKLALEFNYPYALSYVGLAKAKLMYLQDKAEWVNYAKQINTMRELFGQRSINVTEEPIPHAY